jgi:hypothetical protein
VTVSIGSTVVAEAVTATLGGLEEPPQPERLTNVKIAMIERMPETKNRFENIRYPPPHPFL